MARALPVMREVVLNHKDENVAIVSHKATIRLIISSLLGFDPRGYRDRLDQAPACLNVLDFKDPVRARLMVFNDVSHYVDQPGRSLGALIQVVGCGEAKRGGDAPAISLKARSRGFVVCHLPQA